MLQSLYRSMVIMAAPLILASLGGLITYHAGIINVAMEGLILAGAFAAVTFSTCIQAGLLAWSQR